MSWPGIVTMLVVVTVIWGGFIAALVTAVRCEHRRSRSSHHDPDHSHHDITEVR